MALKVDVQTSGAPTAPGTLEERPFTPVKWWASAGAAVLLFMAYVLTRWILSGDATRTPMGPDSPPGYLDVFDKVTDVLSPILGLLVIYLFVVRPWRRDGRLSVDGMFVIAWGTLMFWEPMLNYTRTWFLYNANRLNFGSWIGQVPGNLNPTGHLLPQPIAFWTFAYIWIGFGVLLAACWAARTAKSRWPRLGKAGMFFVAYFFIAILNVIIEGLIFVRLGDYAFPGTIRWLALFPGKTYQFPLYSSILVGFWYAGAAGVRLFLDRRGEMVVERGAHRLKVSERARTGIRLLAVIGVSHALFVITYVVPVNFLSLHADEFPEDLPSYLTAGMCGEGTEIPCPGRGVPLAPED